MTPDDPRHGTEAGHEQHGRDGEVACPACYEAKLRAARRRHKRKAMGHRFTVPAGPIRARVIQWRAGGASIGAIADHTGLDEVRVWELVHDVRATLYARTAVAVLQAKGWPVTPLGITRRVQALTRAGYSIQAIADAAGVHHDSVMDLRPQPREFLARKVRDRILAAYEALSMRPPAPTTQQEKAGVTRARNHAIRQGWASPMAWVDIDDPHEIPAVPTSRARSGRPEVRAAHVENFDWLVSQGESEEHAAHRLGITVETVAQHRRSLEKKAS